MIDLYKGKLTCPNCRHLISTEGKAKENCPYCGKWLPEELAEHWKGEEKARELRKRNFESNLEEEPAQSEDFDLTDHFYGKI